MRFEAILRLSFGEATYFGVNDCCKKNNHNAADAFTDIILKLL